MELQGIRVIRTESPEELRERLTVAVKSGSDRALVAGGDGTMHEAVQVLAGTGCALAPIPLGTGNDLCRSLGLPLDPVEGLRRALDGTVERIDLGRCAGRYFAGIAGTGLDGAVLDFLESRSQAFRGPWVYPYAVLRALASFRPLELSIGCDGTTLQRRVMLAAWANTSVFGGGMKIAPMAEIDDGQLDMILVEAMPKAKLMALFPRVYSGRHLGHSKVTHLRGKRFSIDAPAPLRVHGDGELMVARSGPIEITAVAGRLSVVR